MMESLREQLTGVGRRLLRFERREVKAFRRWIETTSNLVHLTVLFVVPLLLGIVTAVSQALDVLPYLLFPPLASGSYTLFANPESRYASPRRFVGGLTAGALCGWLALRLMAPLWYGVDPAVYDVRPGAVALGLFLTGAVTWALDIEEASAFATALLIHVTGTSQLTYVASVAVSSTLVAGTFVLWREYVYEERAQFLYQSTKGDDHVLVPMRGQNPGATAALAARLAAAHDAGKVVLLDVVADEDLAETERTLLAEYEEREASVYDEATSGFQQPAAEDDAVESGDVGHGWSDYDAEALADRARERAVAESATALETQAEQLQTTVGIPCEVVVAVGRGSLSKTIARATAEANCDLIATPYETEDGRLATYIRDLFRGETDVLVHQSHGGRTRWKRVMVPVRKAGDVAHSMIDFATRLTGTTGTVSVCHCVDGERSRREAESMLADLVETSDGSLETRVSRGTIQEFLAQNAGQYDLVILGASQDRSAASRFVTPPTFERISDVETDVAIVDRNY